MARLVGKGFNAERTGYSLFGIGHAFLIHLWQFDGQFLRAGIDDLIVFHQSRLFGRRKVFTDDFPLSASAFVVIACYLQNTFQFNAFYLLGSKGTSVDVDHIQYIPIVSTHQAGMGIVRNGTEQRPYHAFIQDKSSVFHSIAKHYGYALSTHFDVVLVSICLFGLPTDMTFLFQGPTLVILSVQAKRHQGDAACQKNLSKCFHGK